MGLFFSLSDRDRARTLCDEKYMKEELKNVEQAFVERRGTKGDEGARTN